MTVEDAHAELAYIRRLMEDTRQAAYVSGGYFIVWGIVIGLGLIASWMGLIGVLPVSEFVSWTACLLMGGIGTGWLVRQEMREPVEAPAGRLIGMVWMSMGITMLIIFFIGVGSGTLHGSLMSPISSALVGSAVFLTGTLAGINWLRNLAFGWWAGAAVMFAWPGMYMLLLMGLMLFAFYVIPGIVLIVQKRQAKRAVAGD